MVDVAKKHSDRLKEIKERIEEAHEYFEDNIKRFEKFVKFVFKSSLTDDEAATLASTGKPTLEFNILEAYISRQRGEFAKQQPSLSVRVADGVPISSMNQQFLQTVDVVEAHLRAIFFDGTTDMMEYNVFSDLLAGGFSGMRVYTEYVNEMSFEQNICVERVFDPTLMVFDPMARKSHKGDGQYCAEFYPMTKKSFEDEYGEEAAREMKFTKELGGFSWSFQNEQEKVILIADYYEKKRRKETILKLSNGHSVTKKEYEKMLIDWEIQGNIEQPPIPINERKTTMECICRYRICESKVLDYVETDFKYLPLVFVDGNSVMLKEGGSYEQMTRPWCYHAEGIQRLKNFAGASLANELENTVQHKFIACIEGIPEDYQEAYQNVQKADVLLFNHFLDTNNPNVTLPAPREVMRGPIPPEISNTFRMSDEMTQTILGNYDASQGVSNGQLSGIAFARSAIQSNNATVPYIVGYIKALNRVAEIIIDLMPKYYRTPRSLPITLPNGKRSYQMVNKSGSLYMNFDPNSLQVKVDTGVNFAMQKEIALQTIIAMSQANQGFAAFFNEEGLPTLLDNIDIRGIDQLKVKAEGWMQKQKQMQQQSQQQGMQMQQQAQQMQQQGMQMQMQKQQMELAEMQKDLQGPTPAQIKLMEMQQKAQIDQAKLSLQAKDSETKFLETISKIRSADVQNELKAAEIDAEQARTQVDMAISVSSHMNENLERKMKNEKE